MAKKPSKESDFAQKQGSLRGIAIVEHRDSAKKLIQAFENPDKRTFHVGLGLIQKIVECLLNAPSDESKHHPWKNQVPEGHWSEPGKRGIHGELWPTIDCGNGCTVILKPAVVGTERSPTLRVEIAFSETTAWRVKKDALLWLHYSGYDSQALFVIFGENPECTLTLPILAKQLGITELHEPGRYPPGDPPGEDRAHTLGWTGEIRVPANA
ncbi:hypothetical protein JNK13_00310 [bacterium]|nr:hypothetical protein [bacterium]